MGSVDQAVPQVQDMRLCRRAGLQRYLDSRKHGPLFLLENQGEDLDHLTVAAWRLEHALLERSESGRKFGEQRAIA